MIRIFSTVLILALMACSAKQSVDGELPSDLNALQKLEKQKKNALRSLQEEIAQIEDAIHALDSSRMIPRKLVSVRKIERKAFNRFVTIQGRVESDDIVTVASEQGGRIEQLLIEEGEAVRKGQLAAKIDMETVNKQISELETQLDLARDIYERQSRLWKQNIGSEVQYLQAKNNVERLEKNVEVLQYQMTKAKLYAPISGVVDIVYLKAGEMAGPGVPIATIMSTSRVKVVADVPENFLRSVRYGETVKVFFPALAEEREARISMVGRKIDPANRTFKIEIDVHNRGGLLKPNLLSEVRIRDKTVEDAIVVPRELVQQEVGGKDYVMVRDSNGEGDVARKIYVETGESFDGEVVITSGLTGDEQVIYTGARGLTENEFINVTYHTQESNG